MQLTGNTILITGGGSGIGLGLARALYKLGNTVIVSGRRRAKLDHVVASNPGIIAVEIDVADPGSIADVAATVASEHPSLNVLINNAGIMVRDNAGVPIDDEVLISEVETNLLGPIRLTSALIEHLKRQPRATIIYNSSALAFTPLAPFSVYSATKAALHSYALSQRLVLRETTVRVQELVPPWVATDLIGAADDPRAMPLDAFIAATMVALGTDAEEVLVDEARVYRNNAGPNEHAYFNEFNTFMLKEFAPQGAST